MIRILIADDHPVVRMGLRSVLETADDLEVVGESSSADEAVTRVAEAARGGSPIDVVTMDLRFGDGPTGADATARLRDVPGGPAVLILTNYDDDTDILRAIEAGASGALLKDAPPRTLIEAVRDAAAGRTVVAPSVASRLVARMRQPEVRLTGRERDVLLLLAEGLSNHEIGERLVLSQPTVKSHLARLYAKLGVSSRTAAIARARSAGLLTDS